MTAATAAANTNVWTSDMELDFVVAQGRCRVKGTEALEKLGDAYTSIFSMSFEDFFAYMCIFNADSESVADEKFVHEAIAAYSNGWMERSPQEINDFLAAQVKVIPVAHALKFKKLNHTRLLNTYSNGQRITRELRIFRQAQKSVFAAWLKISIGGGLAAMTGGLSLISTGLGAMAYRSGMKQMIAFCDQYDHIR